MDNSTKHNNSSQVDMREEIAVMRLEKLIYDIRDTLVDGSCKLPFFSSFEYAIQVLHSKESLLYIAGLLQECLIIVCPLMRSDRPIKDDLSDILDKVLSNYSSEKSEDDEFDVKELDRDLTYCWANIAGSNTTGKDTRVTLNGYRSYLKMVYMLLSPKFEDFAMKLREDFVVDRSISIPGVAIGRVKRVANHLIREGYIQEDSFSRFVSCFTDSPTLPESPIIWRDWSNKRKEYSIASLYTVFKALGLPMTIPNRKTICKLFLDGNGNAIDYLQLKPRKSEKLKKLENKIKTL